MISVGKLTRTALIAKRECLFEASDQKAMPDHSLLMKQFVRQGIRHNTGTECAQLIKELREHNNAWLLAHVTHQLLDMSLPGGRCNLLAALTDTCLAPYDLVAAFDALPAEEGFFIRGNTRQLISAARTCVEQIGTTQKKRDFWQAVCSQGAFWRGIFPDIRERTLEIPLPRVFGYPDWIQEKRRETGAFGSQDLAECVMRNTFIMAQVALRNAGYTSPLATVPFYAWIEGLYQANADLPVNHDWQALGGVCYAVDQLLRKNHLPYAVRFLDTGSREELINALRMILSAGGAVCYARDFAGIGRHVVSVVGWQKLARGESFLVYNTLNEGSFAEWTPATFIFDDNCEHLYYGLLPFNEDDWGRRI